MMIFSGLFFYYFFSIPGLMSHSFIYFLFVILVYARWIIYLKDDIHILRPFLVGWPFLWFMYCRLMGLCRFSSCRCRFFIDVVFSVVFQFNCFMFILPCFVSVWSVFLFIVFSFVVLDWCCFQYFFVF